MVINSTSSTQVSSSDSSLAIGPIIGGAVGGIVVLAGALYVLMCRKTSKTGENSKEISETTLQKISVSDKQDPTSKQVKITYASQALLKINCTMQASNYYIQRIRCEQTVSNVGTSARDLA